MSVIDYCTAFLIYDAGGIIYRDVTRLLAFSPYFRSLPPPTSQVPGSRRLSGEICVGTLVLRRTTGARVEHGSTWRSRRSLAQVVFLLEQLRSNNYNRSGSTEGVIMLTVAPRSLLVLLNGLPRPNLPQTSIIQ